MLIAAYIYTYVAASGFYMIQAEVFIEFLIRSQRGGGNDGDPSLTRPVLLRENHAYLSPSAQTCGGCGRDM